MCEFGKESVLSRFHRCMSRVWLFRSVRRLNFSFPTQQHKKKCALVGRFLPCGGSCNGIVRIKTI